MNHKRASGVVLEAGELTHVAGTVVAGTTAGADGRLPSAARALSCLLVVLLVVAGLLALRHGMHHPTAAAVTMTSSGPKIAELYDDTRRYDGLPGRTRLSLPKVDGDQVAGSLPYLPGPSRAAAAHAAALVLQRYCANPDKARMRLVDEASVGGLHGSQHRGGGWWSVTVQTRSPASPPITISLLWTDPSYSWAGSLRQLVGCA
jgi:hypothetical protein